MRALFGVDSAMADVVRTSSQPMLGQIRLAWWRERLEQLNGDNAPAEPRLKAVETNLLPRGIVGAKLARLESGWARLFEDFPWGPATSEAIWLRGHLLFGLGAQILGGAYDAIERAGGLWALVDAARHCSDPPSRAMLTTQSRTLAKGLAGVHFPAALRPISGLAALAVRDLRRDEPFEPEATRGRAAAMLVHRLTGRLPRLG